MSISYPLSIITCIIAPVSSLLLGEQAFNQNKNRLVYPASGTIIQDVADKSSNNWVISVPRFVTIRSFVNHVTAAKLF